MLPHHPPPLPFPHSSTNTNNFPLLLLLLLLSSSSSSSSSWSLSFRKMEKQSRTYDEAQAYSPPFITEPKGYELSGKIMLSAIIILFAVVVIMVCLHIYARWYILRARRRNVRRARRRTHLVFYIEPNNPSNIVPYPTHGLDPALVKSLPTFLYNNNVNVKSGGYGGGDGGGDVGEEVLECAVCLSEFEEGEKGRMLPKCNHCFHVDCIDMWFHSHDTCPLCRAPVEASDLPVIMEESGQPAVELTESTQPQPQLQLSESVEQVGPSRVGSLSFGGRRKGAGLVGVTIEVPRRCQSFSFTNSDDSGPSRSPSHGGFIKSPLSLKRIFSREKKSPLPLSSPPPSASRVEVDIELGRVDPVTPTS